MKLAYPPSHRPGSLILGLLLALSLFSAGALSADSSLDIADAIQQGDLVALRKLLAANPADRRIDQYVKDALEKASPTTIRVVLEAAVDLHDRPLTNPDTNFWSKLVQRDDSAITSLALMYYRPAGWSDTALNLARQHRATHLFASLDTHIAGAEAIRLGFVDLALALGVDKDSFPEILAAMLISAIGRGDTDKIDQFHSLLAPDLKYIKGNQRDRLFEACEKAGLLDTAELLLEQGADIDDDFVKSKLQASDEDFALWLYGTSYGKRKLRSLAFQAQSDLLDPLVVLGLPDGKKESFSNLGPDDKALVYLASGVDPACDRVRNIAGDDFRLPTSDELRRCLFARMSSWHNLLIELYFESGVDASILDDQPPRFSPLGRAAYYKDLRLLRQFRAAGAPESARRPHPEDPSPSYVFWAEFGMGEIRSSNRSPILPRGYGLQLPLIFEAEEDFSRNWKCTVDTGGLCAPRPGEECELPIGSRWSIACEESLELELTATVAEDASEYRMIQLRHLLFLRQEPQNVRTMTGPLPDRPNRWNHSKYITDGYVNLILQVEGYALNSPEIDWLAEAVYESIAVPSVDVPLEGKARIVAAALVLISLGTISLLLYSRMSRS